MCTGLGIGLRAHSQVLCPLPLALTKEPAPREGKRKERAREPLTRETSGRVFILLWTASPVSSRSRVF